MSHKCSILGCDFEFVDQQSAEVHAATSWHCISCGYSDDREVTIHNIATKCEECDAKHSKWIRVNFKRKAYVVNGRLSIKEKGKWVHYE